MRARGELLDTWPDTVQAYAGDEYVVNVRGRGRCAARLNFGNALGHPGAQGRAAAVRGPRRDPALAAGGEPARVVPVHRRACSRSSARTRIPTRMFAGEGDPFRTNRRFHLLSRDMPAKRLSTAFDSVTLYGFDPDERPDIYGKVGNSGVSIATLDDMKALYSGFDLCDPGDLGLDDDQRAGADDPRHVLQRGDRPAAREASATEHGREPGGGRGGAHSGCDAGCRARHGAGRHPEGGPGPEHLHLLDRVLAEGDGRHPGVLHREPGAQLLLGLDLRLSHRRGRGEPDHPARVHARERLHLRRGLPRARACAIDDFAPNLSFFFSYGMDPEYAVLGRVARRIWAVAMRERYGANERSQKLKFHSQTSGRSLHAQEIAFNDIRTTLQALIATYDNTNSLHTNAYDEAITTPTEDSVRRAMAIQMIINTEWGLAQEREPEPGLVRDRGADRSRRGGGAEGVRGDLRARRGARRDGDGLPARQDPGGVALLRAQEARRLVSHHRGQHVPQSRVTREEGAPYADRWS